MKIRVELYHFYNTFRHDIYFPIWLEFHKIKCRFWNWRIHSFSNKDLVNKYYKEWFEWINIDRKKNKSMVSQDFKFWLYTGKVRKNFWTSIPFLPLHIWKKQ